MDKKILILSANPRDKEVLLLNDEFHLIKESISSSRNCFIVEQESAVHVRDLQQIFVKHEPQIVYFSGHGKAEGLLLLDDRDKAQLVSKSALSGLIELFKHCIECVILNACHTMPLAKAMHQHIKYVIGVNNQISDSGARSFAKGFFMGLCHEASYRQAFKYGFNAIEIDPISKESPLVLLENVNMRDVNLESYPRYTEGEQLTLRLRNILLDCNEFNNDTHLISLFGSEPKLHSFSAYLPDSTGNRNERVNKCLAFLIRKRLKDNTPLLLPFLDLLLTRQPKESLLYDNLNTFIQENARLFIELYDSNS